MSEDFDIGKTSRLARLRMTPEEEAEFAPQLETILSHIDLLSELDVSAVEPSAHASSCFATARSDEPRPSLPSEAFEQNVPSAAQGQVKVPRVVES